MLARGFLEAGALVTISSNEDAELGEAQEKLGIEYGDRVFSSLADVTNSKDCDSLMNSAQKKYGTIDAVVCNAGIDIVKTVQDYTSDEWSKILDVNLKGVFNIAQSGIKYFLDSKSGGSIIATSSIAGSIGIAGLVPYSASKGGINQLVKSMSVELAEKQIRVNAVAPGYVENIMKGVEIHKTAEENKRIESMTPMRRRCRPEELVGPYIFLASDASSYVTGAVIAVDGGYTAL